MLTGTADRARVSGGPRISFEGRRPIHPVGGQGSRPSTIRPTVGSAHSRPHLEPRGVPVKQLKSHQYKKIEFPMKSHRRREEITEPFTFSHFSMLIAMDPRSM